MRATTMLVSSEDVQAITALARSMPAASRTLRSNPMPSTVRPPNDSLSASRRSGSWSMAQTS